MNELLSCAGRRAFAGGKENDMKAFCKPEMDVIEFSAIDVLTASTQATEETASEPTTESAASGGGVELPEDPL